VKGKIVHKAKGDSQNNLPAMNNDQLQHNPSEKAPQLVSVRFEFHYPKAASVCIVGTFNHWKLGAHNLNSSGAGDWWQILTLAPGAYEYCLVVDGQWMPDPQARESVPNPYGGRNSILKVTGDPAADHLADAENNPMIQEKKL
jgi:1,4-alpha-glucan branching enzyme